MGQIIFAYYMLGSVKWTIYRTSLIKIFIYNIKKNNTVKQYNKLYTWKLYNLYTYLFCILAQKKRERVFIS